MGKIVLSKLQKEILNDLVDRYEKRQSYGTNQKSKRRTMIKIASHNFPGYYHASDSSYRLLFNSEAQQLEQEGLVTLQWERFNEKEYLERISLNEDNLKIIYEILKRRSKKELYRSTAQVMEKWSEGAPPELKIFYSRLLSDLNQLKKLPPPIKPEREEELIQLLQGLHACFEIRQSEIPKRLLSVRLYGNSKRWQELERSVVEILRSYCLSENEAAEDHVDILAEKGIVDNPTHINLSGPLIISTNKGRVDLSAFYPDLGLPSEMAKELLVDTCEAEAVITVENKTSFYQYLYNAPASHLVLYLGGYHNPPRRELLQKLYSYLQNNNPRAGFYHWGDLDLGGITIWHNLVEKTGIFFQPIYMDVKTYLNYLDRGQPFDEKYGYKLEQLMANPALEIFHPLIKKMLEHKLRLEQEAVTLLDKEIGAVPR